MGVKPLISKDLVAASATPLILSILLNEGESYGYAIIAAVRDLSDGDLQWTDGMLYPVLHRLEGNGLVRSEWRLSDVGRKRKYYRLTGEGHEVLEQERAQWMRVHATLEKLWVKNHV